MNVKADRYRLRRLIEIRSLLSFIFLFSSGLFSQQSFLDLEKKLPTVSGKEKVTLLNQLADPTNKKALLKTTAYAEEALRLARKIGYPYGEAVALRNMGFNYIRKNELAKAEPNFGKALEIFLQLKDSFQLCETYNQLGLLNWKKDKFIRSYQYYKTSLKIAKNKQFQQQEAQALNYIGLIYWKWGEFPSALEYFMQALAIKKSLHDDFETGVTLNNISNIYNEMNKPDDAIYYANECLKFADSFPNKYIYGRVLNNLGVSYFKKHDFEKAIFYQNKSLKVKIENNDLLGQAFSLSDLGEIYFEKKENRKALNYYQQAYTIWKNLNDVYGLSKTALNIGKVYAAIGKYANAESHFYQSLEEAKNSQNKQNIAQAYLALSALYESNEDFQKALEAHKLYSSVSDSNLNISTSEVVAELRAIKKIDEKEKEVDLLIKEKKIQALEIEKQTAWNRAFLIIVIAILSVLSVIIFRFIKIRKLKILLEEKNYALSQKSKELQEANATKDKFFSIIAHDLKSPFTGLLGYSQILTEEYDSLDRDEKLKTIGYLKNLIERVYSLIENLLDWARIQTGRIEISPEIISLRKEVQEILYLLNANVEIKKLSLSNEIADTILVNADKNSFKSIIQNLVSNAIKFTNTSGAITISAKEKDDFIEIVVSDNGVGIAPDILQKIFILETRHTTKGTASETGTGLGLLLCKELAELNGGSIAIESNIDLGTSICITLPKANNDLGTIQAKLIESENNFS